MKKSSTGPGLSMLVGIWLMSLSAAPTAGPPSAPYTVRIGEAALTPRDGRATASFDVTVTGDGGHARLRVYAASLRGEPVRSAWVVDTELLVDGETTVVVDLLLKKPGDFSLRAIVYPTAGGQRAARSYTEHVFYRFEDGRLTRMSPLAYGRRAAGTAQTRRR